MKLSAEIALDILGPAGMLAGESGVEGGRFVEGRSCSRRRRSIYGGTDEIQRNIVGERMLGLPGEPRADKDVAWKDDRDRATVFAFTEEHDELRATIRAFLAEHSDETAVRAQMATERGYDPEVWTLLAEQLGLPGLIVPEAHGGAGLGYVELCIAMEEMGRALLCAPYSRPWCSRADAAPRAGTRRRRRSTCRGIAAGATIVSLAFAEPNGRWDVAGVEARARAKGAASSSTARSPGCSTGTSPTCCSSRRARTRASASSASTGDAEGLVRTPLPTLDTTRKLARDRARGDARDGSSRGATRPRTSSALLELAAVALAAEQVGGAQRCLEMATDVRQDAAPVRPADRLLPGDQAQVRRHARRGRVRPLGGVLRGVVRRGGRRADFRRSAALAKAYCSEAYFARRRGEHPDPRRHRLHLGAPRAPLLQAREVARRCCSATPRTTASASRGPAESSSTLAGSLGFALASVARARFPEGFGWKGFEIGCLERERR